MEARTRTFAHQNISAATAAYRASTLAGRSFCPPSERPSTRSRQPDRYPTGEMRGGDDGGARPVGGQPEPHLIHHAWKEYRLRTASEVRSQPIFSVRHPEASRVHPTLAKRAVRPSPQANGCNGGTRTPGARRFAERRDGGERPATCSPRPHRGDAVGAIHTSSRETDAADSS